MTETYQTKPYQLGSDEKAVQVMVYTPNAMCWGEIVVKKIIRVSTWMRTNSAPDQVCLFNARVLSTSSGTQARPMAFSEVYIPTSQITAFHLVPPAADPLDYDPSEPNRRMQPVTILVSNFRIDGHMRLAVQTALSTYLEITREPFSAVYDARVSSPTMPSFGTAAVPYLVVRKEMCLFSQAAGALGVP